MEFTGLVTGVNVERNAFEKMFIVEEMFCFRKVITDKLAETSRVLRSLMEYFQL